MAAVTYSETLAKVCSILKIEVADAPAYYEQVIVDAITASWNQIKTKLIGRGYSISQVQSWDRAREFNLDGATYWAFTIGGIPRPHDREALNKLEEKLAELDTVDILVGDELIEPDSTTIGSTVRFGPITAPANTPQQSRW